jgi:hypothetical protein
VQLRHRVRLGAPRGLLQNWLTWDDSFSGVPAGCSIESGYG